MTTMTYDGYVASIELDEAAGVFHGEVINTRDVLTFQGRTLDELKIAFADTIADYFEWCRERGKEPQRPYSGNFTVRVSPELHRRVATTAARKGKSVNAFVAETLERSAEKAGLFTYSKTPKDFGSGPGSGIVEQLTNAKFCRLGAVNAVQLIRQAVGIIRPRRETQPGRRAGNDRLHPKQLCFDRRLRGIAAK